MLSLAAAEASLAFLVPPTVSVAATVPAVGTTALVFKLENVGNPVSSAVIRVASIFQGLRVRWVGLIFRSLLSVIFLPAQHPSTSRLLQAVFISTPDCPASLGG